MVEAQGNKCACCGTTEWGHKGPMVDHDHNKKGRESVRGILCSQCNLAIGKLGDNYKGVLKALKYLLRYERPDLDW